MKMITIKRKSDGEILHFSRDVSHAHPAWVHEQMDTSSEVELQQLLDSLHVWDWYSADGSHRGPDGAGVSMYRVDT